MEECLKSGIPVLFLSSYGHYYGKLISTGHVNAVRQRKQILCPEEKYLEISKKIIYGKIQNQSVILRRYSRSTGISCESAVTHLKILAKKASEALSEEKLLGYEGSAARLYFKTLNSFLKEDFSFNKRFKRPPLDPFNSMISYGYTLLMYEICALLESKGLNAYFGIMHSDQSKHPSLASDLMEEWRAPFVDSLIVGMINGNEVHVDDFRKEGPGVYMGSDCLKKVTLKFENQFVTRCNYIPGVEYDMNYRQAMEYQINRYARFIDSGNPEVYSPILFR